MYTPVIIYPQGQIVFDHAGIPSKTSEPIGAHNLRRKPKDEVDYNFEARGITNDSPIIHFRTSGDLEGMINQHNIKTIFDPKTIADHKDPFSRESLEQSLTTAEKFFKNNK